MADKLELVRKLLAKADSIGLGKPEAESFINKAADMIADHGIDVALLLAAKPESDAIEDLWVPVMPPFARELSVYLLNAVAEPLGLMGLHVSPDLRAGNCDSLPDDMDEQLDGALAEAWLVHLVGYGRDIERWHVMFTSVMLQCGSGLAKAAQAARDAGRGRHDAGGLAAFQRRYIKGFAAAVFTRLSKAEGAAKARATGTTGKPGTAVVLRDRATSVHAAFAQAHPNTRRTRNAVSGPGTAAGYADGMKADLDGGTRVGAGARRELA